MLFEDDTGRVDRDDEGILPRHRGIDGSGIMKATGKLREQRVLDGEFVHASCEGGDPVAARQGGGDGESAGALRGTYDEQAERGHRVSEEGGEKAGPAKTGPSAFAGVEAGRGCRAVRLMGWWAERLRPTRSLQ